MTTATAGTAAAATVQRAGAVCDPAQLQRQFPDKYPFLLESSAHGRFDILAAYPLERLTRHADGSLEGPGAEQGSFLGALDSWFARVAEPAALTSPDLPFAGGWFLFLAYELAAEIETRLRLRADPDLPIATAVRVPGAVLRDRVSGTVWLVAESGHEALLDRMAADIAALAPAPGAPSRLLAADPTEDEPTLYLDAVARARRYIHDGDVFQANLSRTWRAPLASGVTAQDLHARLREANPAPFAALAELGTATLVSCSPERLVEVRGRRIQTRPIAGTRPRGADPATDAQLRAELLANDKERAEHVMLVDLERNDLSRVAQPGTVRVPELMTVESYATVQHLVSNVEGQLRAGVTPGQVIAAVFPGGTITGCPKVRCMEIIDELEAAPRGAYTGSLGYLGRDGSLDLNILIRTVVVAGGAARWRAGAGIVSDSVPERELEETRAKARGLGRALGAA